MKLGRIFWLILGLGIFVIVAATLITMYIGKSGDEKTLVATLAEEENNLNLLIAGRETAETRLAEAQSQLSSALQSLSVQGVYSQLAENIEYDEVLAELAIECDLEIMSLRADLPGELEVGDITYSVISFMVIVRGDVNNMLSMVSAIANDERLLTSSVELVSIETRIEEAREPLGTITFTGYSYPR